MFTEPKEPRSIYGRGFSLLELIITVSMVLIIAAIALPSVITFINNYKLKSAASQLGGLIQQCRINAVRTNSVISVQAAGQQIYVDLDGNNAYTPASAGVAAEPMMMLPRGVTLETNGFPGDASAILGYSAQPVGTAVRFNARGIPCRMNAGVCTTDGSSVGFVYYLQNNTGSTNNGWAAVRINPVGRITSVMWTGINYQ